MQDEARRALEAVIMVADQPADPAVLAQLVELSPAAVEEFMAAIWSLDETIAVTMLTGAYDVLVHVSVRDVKALSETVLTAVANAPHVSDEQTSIVFEHRAKRVLGALA